MFTPLFYVIIRGLVARRSNAGVDAPTVIRSWPALERPLAVAEGDLHA
jgi:hypothetical protein